MASRALELTEVPARLAVIGANAIGLELGQAFAHLGSEVTFLDIAERIAPFEEPELSAALAEVLTSDGARILAPANIRSVTQAPDGTVTLEGDLGDGDTTLTVDRVLVATGRAPNSSGLDFDAAGVEADSRGFVVPRAIVNRDTRGVIKLVADADTGRLLGVHMAGDSAGEVIQAGIQRESGAAVWRRPARDPGDDLHAGRPHWY